MGSSLYTGIFFFSLVLFRNSFGCSPYAHFRLSAPLAKSCCMYCTPTSRLIKVIARLLLQGMSVGSKLFEWKTKVF